MEFKKITDDVIISFLKESNAIEDVWDEDSLKQAIFAWDLMSKCSKLTIGNILDAHKVLMAHQSIEEKYKGALRDIDVQVAGRICERPDRLPTLIDSWVKLVNVTVKMPHSLNENFFERYIQKDHVHFEKIHPFIDGNGRIGRMLMAWECLRSKSKLPMILEKEKYDYYIWFL